MKPKDAERVVTRFWADLKNGYYRSILLDASHYRLARNGIGMFSLPLKPLEALHLTISSSDGLDIVTTDPGLFKSAKALSLNRTLLE